MNNMTLISDNRTMMSQREREEFDQEKLMAEMQSAHSLKIKQMDIELAKLEARWSVLLKLPMAIVMLPVRILVGIGFIISSFREDFEPGENYWSFLGLKRDP